jgi:hypothetical protein
MIVALGRKQAKDMFRFAFGVPLARNSCEVGEVYLVAEFCTVVVFVYRECVWAKDERDGFP